MAEHPNVQLLREVVGSLMQGDVSVADRYLADDVVYHVSGDNPFAGEYSGRDDVLRFFAAVREATGGTLSIEGHDVLATDRHGVALVRLKATRGGRELSWNQTNVYHLHEGKIAEAWLQPADQRAVDEFLS